jgi:hypothetical protein
LPALAAPDPLALPWISAAMTMFGDILADLAVWPTHPPGGGAVTEAFRAGTHPSKTLLLAARGRYGTRAWKPLGTGARPHESRLERPFCVLGAVLSEACAPPERPLEDGMEDLFYIALTIVVFGVLWLILKGVERFER